MDNLNALQQKLNYQFNKTEYIKRALTHSSTHHASSGLDYERLEFLGDRVVNLIVADLLFHMFDGEDEGGLAKRHTALIRTETLSDMAIELTLGDFIIFSDSEKKAGGSENINILADVMESVTSAIYLDGGYIAAKKFIEKILGDRLHKMTEPPRDAKSTLQEWSQEKNLGLPVYEVIETSGPDHMPEFIVQVSLPGYEPQQASSTSKKKAEKEAAKKMLELIQR